MLAGGTLRGVLRHPDPPLSDGVITLRAKARADVDALTAACQDPEIPRWTLRPLPYRRDDALGWIAASELELDAGLALDWLAVDAEDRLLASIALMGIDRERGTAEIGYWVAREARGRGVATRAVRLVARLGGERARAHHARARDPRGQRAVAGRGARGRVHGDRGTPAAAARGPARGRLPRASLAPGGARSARRAS